MALVDMAPRRSKLSFTLEVMSGWFKNTMKKFRNEPRMQVLKI